MADEDNWDLYAIVRSCSSATNTTTSSPTPNPINSDTVNVNTNNNLGLTFDDHEEYPFSFPNLVQSKKNTSVFQELHDSYKPFLPSNTITTPFRCFGGFGSSQNQYQSQLLQLPALQNQLQASHGSGILTSSPVATPRSSQSQTPKSRKKKNIQKRTVVRLTAENLADDVWAWRKYGQKPIKGSPYPRNYYRCSSSKGCVARKQVERCNKDPNTFIVSYTGEHSHPRPTHRNSLAGSTRNKFQTSQKQENNNKEANNATTTTTATATACSSSPVLSTTSLSPTTPLSSTVIDNQSVKTKATETCQAMESDEEDDILIPNNIALNEDLIKELHELGGGSSSDSFGLVDHSPDFDDNFSNWTVGSPSATAAGDPPGNGC